MAMMTPIVLTKEFPWCVMQSVIFTIASSNINCFVH